MRGMHVCVMGLASLILALVLGSCGKVADGGIQIDSNTNWLKRCESNAECSGALACLCGQCTQPCSEAAECGLLDGASCGSASGGACSANPGAGGLCVLECSSASDCGHEHFTCKSGQCVPLPREDAPAGDESQPGAPGGPSSACLPGGASLNMDDVFELIADDSSGEDADDQINYRYLSLANRWNAGLCPAELDVERAAMIKMLNSVSRSPTPEVPSQVDADGLLYRVDMRDYEWDRPLTVGASSYADVWEALAERDPFSMPWQGDTIDDLVSDTGTAFPVMFVSGFILAATEPSTYYALIGVPENIDAFLLGQLGIDTSANFVAEEMIRAGFSGASVGMPDDAFLAERHDTEVRAGYLWQIANFGTPGDLLAHPLGTPAGDRELIFTLENSMLGFAFFDAGGNRMDQSSAFSNGSVLPIRASFGRYASGVLVTDEIRGALESGSLAHVSVEDVPRVQQLYPLADQLARVVEDDRELYARALTSADLDIDATDPISRTYAAFADDVDLNVAAGDLMVTPDGLRRDLRELETGMQILGNGRVSREAFTLSYRRSLCILSVALENTPDVALCDALASGL